MKEKQIFWFGGLAVILVIVCLVAVVVDVAIGLARVVAQFW